jgi:ABC-2 type transport system permease protein
VSAIGQAAAIAGRDVRATLGSALGVGVAAAFSALSGVLLIVELRGDQARLDGWFGALFIAMGVLAALLSMQSFANDERTGELELLLTAPLRGWQVISAKLAAGVAVLGVVLACTLGCPILLASMGSPDSGPIITGYVGLVLVGVAFLAAGMAVSATTASPLVSAVATAGLLLGLWFGGLLGGGLTGRPRVILDELSPATHIAGFLRGTLGAADIGYFVSFAVLGLTATALVLRRRR